MSISQSQYSEIKRPRVTVTS